MGNSENCLMVQSQPQGSQILQQTNNNNELPQCYKKACSYKKQILPQKVQFFYIHPLKSIQKRCSQLQMDLPALPTQQNQDIQNYQQKNPKKLIKSNKKNSTSSLTSQSPSKQLLPVQQPIKQSKLKQPQYDQQSYSIQNAINKVSVQWNTFAKIKKKSYLEDYIFVKQIGKGAYGSVCKIKMKYGGLERAAKIIKLASLIKTKENQKNFLAEIALPIQMDHPNIIKLFEVFQWKKQFVLVMQLCQGGDLFHRIKQNKIFSQKSASEILKQILSALFYMHKKNIMHRDIKPQNMLYDNESKALKIIDFGSAIKFKNGQKLKNLVGTPYYIAPEVIKGQYDQKCDIWSCGVILFVLLCGYPPFNGKNEKQIMQKITMQPIQFTSDIFNNISSNIWAKRSSKAKQLVLRMLSKKPQDRPSAQQALNSQWILDAPCDIQQNQQVAQQVFGNLKSFQFQNKLKAVVYTYIASQLYSNKDKQVLLKAFREMDKDGNGVIGKEQLILIFNKHSNSPLNQKQVQKILTIVDTNGSGLIDFTEFLVAASNQEKILEKQKLQNAFNYLDTDHSGFISMNQVKQFLDGSEQTNAELKKIFDQVDDNGDGQISKKQFIALLLKKT